MMTKCWWKEAVVYQIYPCSFMDSNSDGIGDIPGIMAKLDYLVELGVDVVWLSPVYRSPGADNGYDISDYYDILPEFGTMADVEQLIHELHARGIKLVMDLIVNHTSDEHPWFTEAKKSRDNPYRDYYIWRDDNNGELPNNWESHFGGSVWEYEPVTEQYYLHIFSKKQPDLNWENPKVRAEVEKIVRFWLEKGIDGFRMDVISFLSKAPGLPSVPGVEGLVRGHRFYMNGPRIHEYLQELNRNVLSQYDIMTVGEIPVVTPEQALEYIGEQRMELQSMIQFEHVNIDCGKRDKWEIVPWSVGALKQALRKWQNEINGRGWNSIYLSNHDQPRQLSRFGDEGCYHEKSAKLLATLIHTLQGTPYVYQGEEIGMTNIRLPHINDYRDIQTLNLYRRLSEQGVPHEEIMELIYYRGRDNARTPMQWSDEANAGFTTGTPWLAVNSNCTRVQVRAQRENADSILSYYKKLISLRKQYPVLVYGDFIEYFSDSDRLIVYRRTLENDNLFVAMNMSAADAVFRVPDEIDIDRYQCLLSNDFTTGLTRTIRLTPYQAVIFADHTP